MSVDENKALMRRFVDEVWNLRNLALAPLIVDHGFVNHDPALPGVRTFEDYGGWFSQLLAAIPDFHVTIEDMVGEGDKVAKRWTARGTFTGEYMGVYPTGKAVTLEGTTTYRIVNGKIAECWWSYDPKELRPQVSGLEIAKPAMR